MKMQMEGGGKLKPLVSLSAPLRLWCGTLSLSTSRTQPLRLHVPLACFATRPFTFFFFFLPGQTLDSLCCAEPMTRGRCTPPRESSLISCCSVNYLITPRNHLNKKQRKVLFYMRIDVSKGPYLNTSALSLCMRMA